MQILGEQVVSFVKVKKTMKILLPTEEDKLTTFTGMVRATVRGRLLLLFSGCGTFIAGRICKTDRSWDNCLGQTNVMWLDFNIFNCCKNSTINFLLNEVSIPLAIFEISAHMPKFLTLCYLFMQNPLILSLSYWTPHFLLASFLIRELGKFPVPFQRIRIINHHKPKLYKKYLPTNQTQPRTAVSSHLTHSSFLAIV